MSSTGSAAKFDVAENTYNGPALRVAVVAINAPADLHVHTWLLADVSN